MNFTNIEKIKAIMSIENLNTIKDLEHFIQSNETEVLPVLGDKQERYRFIQKILVKFGYITLNKVEKGIVNRYIRTVSGYSRQQLTRLIKQYKDKGYIQWQLCRSNG
ncbi:MAG: DNA transposition AAA+ family ATPase, partial [Alteromonadaceae bacterium]